MEHGTITRRMDSVLDGLGEEFKAMYVAADFRRKVARLMNAKSERHQILAELYTMFDECGIPYEMYKGNSYYQKLVETTEFPHFTDLEHRMLLALYDRYTQYPSPEEYMERIVDKLEDPADGWGGDPLRLRILKRFIKYGNYLSDMTELRLGKNGKELPVPKAGGRAAIEGYVQEKTGHKPTLEQVLEHLDDGVFSRLDEVITKARENGDQKVSAAVGAFREAVEKDCGLTLTDGQVAVIIDGQKMKRIDTDIRQAAQQQALRQFAQVWQDAAASAEHGTAIAGLLEAIGEAKKATRKKKGVTVPAATAKERKAALEQAEQALADYARQQLGLELDKDRLELVLSPRKWKAMTESLAEAAGDTDFAEKWDSILSCVEDADRERTLAVLLEWNAIMNRADSPQKKAIAGQMEAIRKAKDYAHEIRQNATALDGEVGLLRLVDDLAKGMFREGGATKRSLYLFAMVYDMTFYTGAEGTINRDTDVEKNLFRDYYSSNLTRFLSASFREKLSETELDPSGQGINYKNFAEMCYLYYISQNIPAVEKIEKSTRMIQRLRESQRGVEADLPKDQGTAYFKGRAFKTQGMKHVFVEDLFQKSEEEFETFLRENYDCNTQRGYTLGVLDLQTDQNTAFENYQEILEKLKELEELEYCNYGLYFSDVGAYKKGRFEEGEADAAQLEAFQSLRAEYGHSQKELDPERYDEFMELLAGVNRLLGRTVTEGVSYQTAKEERRERSKYVIKALSVPSAKRMTRSSMIVAYYYYYNAFREKSRSERLKSFRSFYEDFTEELNDYLMDSNYLPMSSKNIFDVLVAFSAFAYHNIG